jgi:hypothetical protein
MGTGIRVQLIRGKTEDRDTPVWLLGDDNNIGATERGCSGGQIPGIIHYIYCRVCDIDGELIAT